MKYLAIIICIFSSSLVIAQKGLTGRDKYEKTIQDIGDYTQHVPALMSVVLIAVHKDKKGLWQFAKSYGATIGLTYVCKFVINKPRPEGATDGHAFPSGHTSAAFSGASFIQRRYGWTFGIPAYALAGFTAYSRLEGYHDRHDGWDVLGGIVVGVGNTYIFTTPYQRDHYELSFSGGEKMYLLGFKYKF